MLARSGGGLVAHPKAAGCLGDPELTCRLQLDLETIADFRKNNGAAITWTCRSFVRFALEHGLIGGRQVATDGSRFAAASSRRRRQTREEVEGEIKADYVAIEVYLKDLEAANSVVDPAEQAAERQRIKKALSELHQQAETKRQALATTAAKKLVVAEPESVVFGQSDGRQPSFNVQLSVDVETQIIVDSEPIGNPSDSGQLAPTAERLAPILGVRPRASEPAAEAPAGATAQTAAAQTAAAEPTPEAPEIRAASAEPTPATPAPRSPSLPTPATPAPTTPSPARSWASSRSCLCCAPSTRTESTSTARTSSTTPSAMS